MGCSGASIAASFFFALLTRHGCQSHMKGCHGGLVDENCNREQVPSELMREHNVAPKLGAGLEICRTCKISSGLERCCEEIEIQQQIRPPSPQRGRGVGGGAGGEGGVRGIAVLSQPTLLFLHLACLFGLRSGIATLCTVPSLLASLPLAGARGTEIFNSFTAPGDRVQGTESVRLIATL
jgi:hypothetical protein